MADISLTILAEKPEDAGAIERLHERTFGPGRHARTSYRLREKVAHRLDLSVPARGGPLPGGPGWLTPGRPVVPCAERRAAGRPVVAHAGAHRRTARAPPRAAPHRAAVPRPRHRQGAD